MKWQQINMQEDLVTLVDEQDQVIGEMGKYRAHRWPAELHRAISVFCFRKNHAQVELLIQQRSEQKVVGANEWANTVCGNVWPIEDYQECAERRLRDELGITEKLDLKPITKFRYQVQCNELYGENELDQVFACWAEPEITLNPTEVQQTAWINWQQVQKEMKTGEYSYQYAPWFEMLIKDKTVIKNLKKFLES